MILKAQEKFDWFKDKGEKNMNNYERESEKIQKQSLVKNYKKYYGILFSFFIVVIIFLAGLSAGGLMSYKMISVYIDDMQEKTLNYM